MIAQTFTLSSSCDFFYYITTWSSAWDEKEARVAHFWDKAMIYTFLSALSNDNFYLPLKISLRLSLSLSLFYYISLLPFSFSPWQWWCSDFYLIFNFSHDNESSKGLLGLFSVRENSLCEKHSVSGVANLTKHQRKWLLMNSSHST